MREYGKMAGFSASGAFFVSLLVGLVSRNPFGVALARAILFAILFAGLAAGARYLVSKYLLELVGSAPPQDENARGQNVDITLPEENPAMEAGNTAYTRTEPGEPDYSASAEDADEGETTGDEEPLTLESEPQPSSEIGDILGDELDDVLPPLSDAESAPIPETGQSAPAGTDSVEEAESVQEDGPTRGMAEGRDAPDLDAELGRLPDISSLGASSTAGWQAPSGGSPRGGEPSPSSKDAVKGALSSRDPATLARAIRTVLKRDEKG